MNVHEALEEFDRRHGITKYGTQKKLVDMDVVETSLVAHPAHLHEGFVVMKSADSAPARQTHSHLVGAHYLDAAEQQSAGIFGADKLKAGESVPVSKDSSIGRDTCGCLYLSSPDTVAKAAGDDFAEQLAKSNQEARTGQWDGMLTREEVEFMMGKKPEA